MFVFGLSAMRKHRENLRLLTGDVPVPTWASSSWMYPVVNTLLFNKGIGIDTALFALFPKTKKKKRSGVKLFWSKCWRWRCSPPPRFGQQASPARRLAKKRHPY